MHLNSWSIFDCDACFGKYQSDMLLAFLLHFPFAGNLSDLRVGE